jgi:hypothetical protein
MRRALVLVPTLAVVIAVAVLWPFEPDLTAADRAAILALVRQNTSEPVLSVRPKSFWRAEVETGVINGPLDGHGQYFILRWRLGEWRIELERVWVS